RQTGDVASPHLRHRVEARVGIVAPHEGPAEQLTVELPPLAGIRRLQIDPRHGRGIRLGSLRHLCLQVRGGGHSSSTEAGSYPAGSSAEPCLSWGGRVMIQEITGNPPEQENRSMPKMGAVPADEAAQESR